MTIIDNSNKHNSAWWGDLTWPKKPLRCCDIWDTDYNTDNWEPEFMTIFVIWQLIVTLDSIRNSCDVFYQVPTYLPIFFFQIDCQNRHQIQFWPNYTILTKFHNFDQITQFRPNITNLVWAMCVRRCYISIFYGII